MSFFPKKSKSSGSRPNAGGQVAPNATTPRSTVGSPSAVNTTPIGTDRRPVIENKPTSEDRASEAAIRARAHQIWVARGGGEGHDLADWLLAQQELQEQDDAARRSASAGGTT